MWYILEFPHYRNLASVPQQQPSKLGTLEPALELSKSAFPEVEGLDLLLDAYSHPAAP